MNAINVIAPYRHLGMWVFDDPKVGLVQEPFVGGADTLIDQATAHIPNASKGFVMVFSASPFPGSTFQLEWRRADGSGNIYFSPDFGNEGWLCPALLRYFDQPPMAIHVQIRAQDPQ
ncbi:hypothetical protein BA190_11015 [Labrys sp. WJW]|uniref:DUF6717 family protein n=1 Tax=Labrys sp. WJW TaxID=1737983 RepID=UPI000835B1AE|nr:DUF6717 family protein [Labrys sp. WJW]OCC04922.1 hypothetical protein BA190_11015 [Labrys sp. WJW]